MRRHIEQGCLHVMQVQNMERQWGDLDRYRGISTSSKGATHYNWVPFTASRPSCVPSCCTHPCSYASSALLHIL